MSIAALRLQAAALVDMLESVQDDIAALAPPVLRSDVHVTVRRVRRQGPRVDHWGWAEACAAGETTREIAVRAGRSHQAVSAWLRLWAPDVLAQRRPKRLERRLHAQFVGRCNVAVPCVVCGYWVLRLTRLGAWRTCSPRCAEAYSNVSIRRIVNPAYRDWHEHVLAKRVLENPASTETQRRHAERRFAGTTRDHGRWYLAGSVVEQYLDLIPRELRPRRVQGKTPKPPKPKREWTCEVCGIVFMGYGGRTGTRHTCGKAACIAEVNRTRRNQWKKAS